MKLFFLFFDEMTLYYFISNIQYPAYLLNVRCEMWIRNLFAHEIFLFRLSITCANQRKRETSGITSDWLIHTPSTEHRTDIQFCRAKNFVGYGYGNAHTYYTQSQHQQLCRVPLHPFFCGGLLCSFLFFSLLYESSELMTEKIHIFHIPMESRKLFNENKIKVESNALCELMCLKSRNRSNRFRGETYPIFSLRLFSLI